MRVSFIIPVKTITAYVEESISHLQELEGDDWEAIVVTNDEESPPWLDERVMLMASGRVGPGDKRDLAAQVATGEILAFLDDDSYPAENYLEVLRETFMSGHQVVGGPAMTPPDDSYWQQVSGAMYLSRLTGGSPDRYMPVGAPRQVYDWPSVNLAIKRDAFLAVDGFDCKFWPGEDTLLCDKLGRSGITIWYEPRLMVWHHRRRSLATHLQQLGNYGRHRGYFARKYRQTSLRPVYFAPSLLLVCVTAMLFAPWELIRIGCTALVATYLVTQVVGALNIASRTTVRIGLGVLLFSPLSHFFYGLRFLQGFATTKELRSRLR